VRLHHLIYSSDATRELDDAELEAILGACGRNNPARGITGMLLYAGSSFLQVLEGDEPAVDALFERIGRDERHRNVTILESSPIRERSFLRFSMGFRRIGPSEALEHPHYAPFFERGFDPATIGARRGLALEILMRFGLRERA
jgi:hypothetical protein